VITGYYGMNVLTYPKSGTNAGGYAALLLMAGLVVGLYVMFRRRDWL
jgi:magnesium transporter